MLPNNVTPILIVEDDETDGFFLTSQLAQVHLDESVTLVRSGQDALDFLLLPVTPPRLIFLDLHLPGLSGIELLERIRSEPRLRDISVIILSGSINPDDVAACTKLGVTAYLPKPVDLLTFLAIVGPSPNPGPLAHPQP